MTNRISQLERELTEFFVGGRRNSVQQRWIFRVGGNGTPAHEAEVFGPFPSRDEAQAAADEWNRINDDGEFDAPYAWCAERDQ